MSETAESFVLNEDLDWSPEKNTPPFKGGIKPSERFPNHSHILRDLPEFPNKVVRACPLGFEAKGMDKIEIVTTRSREGAKLFGELKDYGIEVPPFQLVIGTENDEPTLFTVTERVDGENLLDLMNDGERVSELQEELDKLFIGLVSYLVDKYRTGENYLDDIFALRQYVYGKAKDGPPRICLVDLDPYYHSVTEFEYEFADEAAHLAKSLYLARNAGYDWEKPRQLFADFLNGLDRHTRKGLSVQSALKFLKI